MKAFDTRLDSKQKLFFMSYLKKSFALVMLLTSILGSRTVAQHKDDAFNLDAMLKFNNVLELKTERSNEKKQERAKQVMQDNEYTYTGFEEGTFFSNPLMLDGKPLDVGEFNLLSRGELTVSKGAVITGQTTQIPFYVYLRRNGNKVLIPGKEISDAAQIKIDISEILHYAKPGDHLVIEAVKKEDGPVKSILKVLNLGC